MSHPLENRLQKKLAQIRPDGYFAIRVYHRAQKGKRSPRYLLKCGCCEQKLEVYYDKNDLEINGVMASIENWRELLIPLLNPKN